MNRASSATGWVRNPDGTLGWTWNPITGCLNGCEYCYARKLANGRLKSRYLANRNLPPLTMQLVQWDRMALALTDPFYPRFWEDRICEPIAYNRNSPQRGIFVCDMSDLFGIGIPEEWTQEVMETIRACPYHRFYLLTKQPQNLIKWSPFPDNCYVGVTATNSDEFEYATYRLRKIDAHIKYISVEPFLNKIYGELVDTSINWVIIGAQTKPTVMPKIEWVQEIALTCTKAHIPLFIKDNLKPLLPHRMPFWDGVIWTEYDKGAAIRMSEHRLRQEMPKIY